MTATYDTFLQQINEVACLESIQWLLDWDRETQIPSDSIEFRANQLKLISKIRHNQLIAPELGDLIETLTQKERWNNLSDFQKTNVRETKRLRDREVNIPTSLVEELAQSAVLSHQAWVVARQKNDFPLFKPHLEKMFDLTRQIARCLKFEHPYEALLNDYEPGLKVSYLETLFTILRKNLIEVLQKIQEKQKSHPLFSLNGSYPKEKQKNVARFILEKLGFNFNQGRLDIAAHPFCLSMPGDIRVATRYNENDFRSSLYGVIHECGHALYEQGFKIEHFYSPMARANSLGIHESQSRFWENVIGRSRPFLQYLLPVLQEHFSENLKGVSPEALFYWCNQVKPSPIRVEADEVTYNLHILLRFELEKKLLLEEIQVSNLPSIWNEKMKEYLGVTPANDAAGVLQDVHWALGLIGYFPTYALGNLYAAQFCHTLRSQMPNLDDSIRQGKFLEIKEWLGRNIHQHGSLHTAEELCQRVTGEGLQEKYFIDYLKTKFQVS